MRAVARLDPGPCPSPRSRSGHGPGRDGRDGCCFRLRCFRWLPGGAWQSTAPAPGLPRGGTGAGHGERAWLEHAALPRSGPASPSAQPRAARPGERP